MNKQYLIIGGIAAIVIFAIYKLSPKTSQTIQTLVPVGAVDSGTNRDDSAFQSARLGALESLLSLGKTQTEADAALGLEGIRSNAQSPMLAVQSSTALALQSLESDLQLSLANVQSETALGLGAQQLQLGRESIGAQLEGLRISGANRANEIEQRITAIQNAGITYRNQSLERQGSILNAILSSFGANPTYNYQSAFGGTRETFADAFSKIGNTVSKFFI